MHTISATAAAEKVKQGHGLIVDVRENDEVASESVPGALHIPLGKVGKHLAELPRDKEVYFLCRSGNRSQLACQEAASHYAKVFSIEGGIQAWRKIGPTQGKPGRTLPLMQQVQLGAGLLVLTGFFVKPVWFLVPLVGAGLTLAGATGFCGMAKLLALMPWNRGTSAPKASICQS